jgi:hypothetical protein
MNASKPPDDHRAATEVPRTSGHPHRAPLEKYPSMLKAVIGLFFFAAYE